VRLPWHPVPLWTPVGWTVLFLAINLYHITRILLEPRPVGFTDDEQRLYDLVFRSFQPQEFMKLVVPVSGSVSAGQGQVQIGKFAPRDMIGTGIAMTGQPSFIDAECTQAVRYICWLTLTSRPFWRRIPVWR
jgi:cell division protein FtsW (lipid II flippase)